MDLGDAALFDQAGGAGPVVDEEGGPGAEVDPTGRLLTTIAEQTTTLRDLELARVGSIVAWADHHTVAHLDDAATLTDRGLDMFLPIAGEGAPLISAFALVELAAVLGLSLDSAKHRIGQIVELAHRLPRLWQQVQGRRLEVWKALRIADQTRVLSAEAAAFVDRHLARCAAGCTWAQVDRLIEEALVRFQPETAEGRRRRTSEHRHVTIFSDAAGHDGTIAVSGVLDAADALDLDSAIRREATQLALLGDQDSLDIRRSKALGQIARRDLALEFTDTADAATEREDADRPRSIRRPVVGRTIELFVHLSDAALGGADPVGRLANTDTPISPETVREWCGRPGTTLIVRPVLDLAGHEPVGAYEIPDRHRRQVLLRDPTCRFPHCTKQSVRCDLDHAVPHAEGGAACPCNLVPLCRTHHRAKTFRDWTYFVLEPGTYLWTSPHHRHWLVDHTGTRNLTLPNCPGSTEPPDE